MLNCDPRGRCLKHATHYLAGSTWSQPSRIILYPIVPPEIFWFPLGNWVYPTTSNLGIANSRAVSVENVDWSLGHQRLQCAILRTLISGRTTSSLLWRLFVGEVSLYIHSIYSLGIIRSNKHRRHRRPNKKQQFSLELWRCCAANTTPMMVFGLRVKLLYRWILLVSWGFLEGGNPAEQATLCKDDTGVVFRSSW